jgi:hypothetical protein
MNERIEKLAEQCWEERKYGPAWFNQEKFAQLIVRECIDCLKPLSRNHSMVGAARDTIREHFGVEG